MLKIEAKLLDVVRLDDGREGTVVEVYDSPPGYEIELSAEEPMLVTVGAGQVVEVIWKAP